MDNVSEKAITSMQRFAEGAARRLVAFSKASDDVLDSFSDDLVQNLSKAKLGGVLNDVINGDGGAMEAAKGIYRHFYTQLDDLGVSNVSNKKAKQIAGSLLKQIEEGGLLKGSDEGAEFIADVASRADNSTFQQAITNRSMLFEKARKFDAAGESNAARLARELGNAMDEAMEATAKSHSPEAHKLWRRGNATFKAVHKRFDSKVITKLAKEVADSPELAASTIFKVDADVGASPTRINKVKKILLSPAGKNAKQVAKGKETWNQLKQSLVENMFRKARTVEDGIVFGKSLQRALHNFGDDALKATFSPEQVKNLREIARLGAVVQGKIKGEGSMFIQLAQPAAVAGTVAGKGKGRLAAMAILVTPPVWSRMALDPKMSNLLIHGLADIDKEGVRASTAATQKLLRVYFMERDKYLGEQAALEKKSREEAFMKAQPSIESFRGFKGRGL